MQMPFAAVFAPEHYVFAYLCKMGEAARGGNSAFRRPEYRGSSSSDISGVCLR